LVLVEETSLVRMLRYGFAEKTGYILTFVHVFAQKIFHLEQAVEPDGVSFDGEKEDFGELPSSQDLENQPAGKQSLRKRQPQVRPERTTDQRGENVSQGCLPVGGEKTHPVVEKQHLPSAKS